MIGIDLVKTDRIKRLLDLYGEKFLHKILSKEEVVLFKNYRNFAGFFAVKEACAKALGCGIGAECGFHDIIISKTNKGAPKVSLSPRVQKSFEISCTSVSITHDGDYAIAVVALESNIKGNQ
ncbi:MAG: holo-ACP synthase [Epsilonproteobacteria bacterium]|nr:holo-ACP synthase [Campylobacterota bacterium]